MLFPLRNTHLTLQIGSAVVYAHNDPTGRPRVLLIPDELPEADPELQERLEASAARTRDVVDADDIPELCERLTPTG